MFALRWQHFCCLLFSFFFFFFWENMLKAQFLSSGRQAKYFYWQFDTLLKWTLTWLNVPNLCVLKGQEAEFAGIERCTGSWGWTSSWHLIYLLSADPNKLKDYYLQKILDSFTSELDFFCFHFKKVKLIYFGWKQLNWQTWKTAVPFFSHRISDALNHGWVTFPSAAL